MYFEGHKSTATLCSVPTHVPKCPHLGLVQTQPEPKLNDASPRSDLSTLKALAVDTRTAVHSLVMDLSSFGDMCCHSCLGGLMLPRTHTPATM